MANVRRRRRAPPPASRRPVNRVHALLVRAVDAPGEDWAQEMVYSLHGLGYDLTDEDVFTRIEEIEDGARRNDLISMFIAWVMIRRPEYQ